MRLFEQSSIFVVSYHYLSLDLHPSVVSVMYFMYLLDVYILVAVSVFGNPEMSLFGNVVRMVFY